MTDWTQKLAASPEPVVRPMPKARIGLKKGDLCLLPSARLVDGDSQGQAREHS